MMVNNLDYKDLVKHADHTLRFWSRYDEQAGIECVECNEGLVLCESQVLREKRAG